MTDVAWQRRQDTIEELTHGMYLASRRYISVNVPPGTKGTIDYLQANGILLEKCPHNPRVTQIAKPWDVECMENGWRVYIQWPKT